MTSPRYVPGRLPDTAPGAAEWGAWDIWRADWVRRGGTSTLAGTPEPFTSEERVTLWAARQVGGSSSGQSSAGCTSRARANRTTVSARGECVASSAR